MGGDVFRDLRLHQRLTQKQFADLLGLSESHINNIEAGRRIVTDKTKARLALNLDVGQEFSSFLSKMKELDNICLIKS